MNTSPASPAGLALVLIVAGLLITCTGVAGAFAIGGPPWRWVLVTGVVVQAAGWRLHAHRTGGAR